MDIADAVADALAEAPVGTFSMAFTPDSLAVPRFTLSEIKTLHVTVVPASVSITGSSRGKDAWEIQIDVGVQKRVTQRLVEPDVLALAALTEEIVDYLRGHRFDALPRVAWLRTQIDPLFAVEHLEGVGTFTSVVRLFYLVHR